MPKPIAIAVVEQEGRFLIGQRSADVPLAGLWEFPGGKVEAGETPEAAAVRECCEETGLFVTVVGLLDRVVYSYPHGDVELHFFACRPVESDQVPATRFRWVRAEELAYYEFPPANARLVERLAAGQIRMINAEDAEDAAGKKRNMHHDEISGQIVDAAMKVHSALGPGLLESAYHACLSYELRKRHLQVESQVALPIQYFDVKLDVGYRIDLLVEKSVIVELKALEKVLPIHESQLLCYLRLSGCRLGLLLNFNVVHLKDGIKRIVNQL